ncbi:DUF2933 domain-containing protein [Noviherbaspirillum agri]
MPHQDLHTTQPGEQKETPFWRSTTGVVAIMLVAIAAFYLLREHWAHVLGSWPYLLLLLCPLMHVFGHGGHGDHGGHSHGNRTSSERKDN